jgi:hypothetical protein
MRTLKSGGLRLHGPADLLETPTDEEIRARIAETPWHTGFARKAAQEDHRLGLIETRAQLEWLCAEVWMAQSFPSWASGRGIRVDTIVRSRRR